MIPTTVLVPTDGSKPAKAAEAMAADIAGAMGQVEIVVINVIPMTCVSDDVISENIVRIKETNYLACSLEQQQSAQSVVDAAVKRVKDAVGTHHVTVTGKVLEAPSPAQAVVEEAHKGGACSLIVMGNRGLGGFGSLALGSVSTQVLHTAHCPVLIVKAE